VHLGAGDMYQRSRGPEPLGMVEQLECRVYDSGHGGGSGRLASGGGGSLGAESPGLEQEIVEPVRVALRCPAPSVHVRGPHAAVFTWTEAQQVDALPAGTGLTYKLEVCPLVLQPPPPPWWLTL
jgi:hypothetical protein